MQKAWDDSQARPDRTYYNLGLDQGHVPAMTSSDDVVTWATNVIEGEARRAALRR